MKKKFFIISLVLLLSAIAYLVDYTIKFNDSFLSYDMQSRTNKCTGFQNSELKSVFSNYGFDLHDIKQYKSNGEKFPVLLMQNDSSDRFLIMVHGKRECPYAMIRGGYRFYQMGYTVVIPVLYAHGQDSLNKFIDYGKYSIDQVITCADEAKKSGANKIGLIGRSMGASIAIIAAAKCKDIDAIVVESPLKSVESSIEYKHKLYSRLPNFPFLYLKNLITEYYLETDLDSLASINFIDRVSPRPIYILASTQDKVLNPQDFEDLYNTAKQPKLIWREDVNHTHFHSRLSNEFYTKIAQFFSESFNN